MRQWRRWPVNEDQGKVDPIMELRDALRDMIMAGGEPLEAALAIDELIRHRIEQLTLDRDKTAR